MVDYHHTMAMTFIIISFIAEFSLDGQLLNSYINNFQSFIGVIWDMVEEEDGSYFVVQHNAMVTNNGGIQPSAFCRFNSDLSVKHPYFTEDVSILERAFYGDIIPANDTSFVLASRLFKDPAKKSAYSAGLGATLFSISIFDTACQLINTSYYGDPSPDATNTPSIWQCADIDKTNPNAFFAAGFSPMTTSPFTDTHSTIFTYKFNVDGTKLWEVKYGGADSATYFKSYATYATQDGGVLLLNMRHAFYSGADADVLIVKYDKDGTLSIEDTEIEPQKINCYPNPATSELHIDIPMHNGNPYLLQQQYYRCKPMEQRGIYL